MRESTHQAPRAELAWWMCGLALLAWGTVFLSRGFEPALPGVWVGSDHLITGVRLLAAFLSQLLAVCVSASVMMLLLASIESRLSRVLQVGATGVGMLVILAVLVTSAARLPPWWRLILGGCTSLFVLALMIVRARCVHCRAVCLGVAGVAAAGGLRLAAIAVGPMLQGDATSAWAVLVPVLATVSLLVEWGVLLWVGLWLLKPRLTALVAVSIGVLLWLGGAHAGTAVGASGWSVLLARISHNLLLLPQPYAPTAFVVAGKVAAFGLALAILFRRPNPRLLGAALALALVAGVTLETPLSAGLLLVAALGVVQGVVQDPCRMGCVCLHGGATAA